MAKRKADDQEEKPKKQTAKQSKVKKAEQEDQDEDAAGDVPAAGDLVTPATRVRHLKSGSPGKGPVIYWYSQPGCIVHIAMPASNVISRH